jgi:NAD(P)-dependent dehydrogenase (short-subunit alcohol dehydrogenase family)
MQSHEPANPTIGNFLRLSSHAGQGANQPGYEDFVEKARAMLISNTIVGSRRISAFSFEDFAQHFSTGVLSIFVILWGWLKEMPGEQWIFYIAGLLGLATTTLAYLAYRQRLRALTTLAERELAERGRFSRGHVPGFGRRALVARRDVRAPIVAIDARAMEAAPPPLGPAPQFGLSFATS